MGRSARLAAPSGSPTMNELPQNLAPTGGFLQLRGMNQLLAARIGNVFPHDPTRSQFRIRASVRSPGRGYPRIAELSNSPRPRKTRRGFDGSKSRRGKHELRRSRPSSEAEPAESISRAGPQRVGRGAGARTAGRKRCLSFGRE